MPNLFPLLRILADRYAIDASRLVRLEAAASYRGSRGAALVRYGAEDARGRIATDAERVQAMVVGLPPVHAAALCAGPVVRHRLRRNPVHVPSRLPDTIDR